MSLDVYLTLPNAPWPSGSGIFIREGGSTREITREEWDAKFPGSEPVTVNMDTELPNEFDPNEVFSANITHNLNTMAGEAGIYEALWRPDEIGISKARQLVEPLRDGLRLLRSDPERFKEFDASNGWGTYDQFVPWVQRYLEACEKYGDANIEVSR